MMSEADYGKFRSTCLKQFGKMLEERRLSGHWSPHDLWLKTGVSPSVVSAVESGEEWPTDDQREKICEFLGYKVDTLAKLLTQAALGYKAQATARSAAVLPGSNVVSLKDFKRNNGEGLPHKGA